MNIAIKIAAALFLSFFLSGAVSTAAFAQTDMFIPVPPPNDQGYRGVFMRNGNSFDCTIGASTPIKAQAPPLSRDQPCLYMGPDPQHAFAIGGEALPLLRRLGQPAQTHSDIAGNTSYVFALAPGEDPPFMMVSVSHELIAGLQISGQGSPDLDFLKFNGIKLGDNSSVIKDALGSPFKVNPSAEPGSEMWSYLPWSFQFEITNAKVTSIRITSLGIK